MNLLLLVGCAGLAPETAPPEPAARVPPPPVVVGDDPGCDTPETCAAACDAGGALACNRLGLWLQDGVAGAARDPEAAAERYRRSCALGAGIGCFNLSHQKAGGQGIPADPAGAAELLAQAHSAYRQSCDAGGLAWCTNLAGLIQRGEGVPPDPAGALALYRTTCERGDALACVEQASMLADGEGGPADPEAAERILQKTCDRGSDEACNNLALIVEDRGEDPRPIFTLACERGVAVACRNLALRTPDQAAALALLIRACDDPVHLDGVACAMAGDLLQASPGEEAKAAPYYERACSVGVGPACLEAVHLASRGLSSLTPDQALPLVERGCALGHAEACAVLRSLPGAPVP